jgi:hypothetical protein
MCEFCLKHGEGEKWYLQAKNYVEEFLTDELKQFLTDHWETLEETLVPSLAAGDQLDVSDPAIKDVLATRVEQTKKQQWGQVIPIENA